MQRNHSSPQQTAEAATVAIPIDRLLLTGDLRVPQNAKGLVIFAHGSGSSRLSPRNRFVAGVLNEHSIGTLLIDLLTPEEERIDEQTAELRFDIPFLAERLEKIGKWAKTQESLRTLKLGYFGASTGGAAALIAAADQSKDVSAVVSRGGRPDLAEQILPQVQAPVLLIVGEFDPQVLSWNKRALEKLNVNSRLQIVPKATHLFEEAGALEAVAKLASDWFRDHFQ